MTAVRALQEEIIKIGYSAVEREYVFPDVFTSAGTNRVAALAAFTYTPPSYRSAALAVVQANGRKPVDIAREYRALGAPLLFVVDGTDVTAWQVKFKGEARALASAHLNELQAMFSAHADEWGPDAIHRAKSIGQFSRPLQLDFVDLELLLAIEGEIHTKLNSLLDETLAEAVGLRVGRARYQIDQRLLFRTVFRLLAAKILQDRGHDLAATWSSSNISSVLNAISKYYRLEQIPGEQSPLQNAIFASAWDRLRSGINFRNISADDLAFVYENTLITPETREHFGTHSTPRPVAEYVVSRLEFWRQGAPENLHVYEPFAGAGIFAVAALRYLRELLPVDWSDKQRHEFLVARIVGDEIDPFAREVATLSLILADYPNANGWAISETDLFKDYQLQKRAQTSNIILCNPPFEDFTPTERAKYPDAAARSVSKPIAALEASLDAAPRGLGFVLPDPFIRGPQYQAQRERIEKLYKQIELVALPDRMFKHSVIRSSLLIAHELRTTADRSPIFLRSTEVSVSDREKFLRSGEITKTRVATRTFAEHGNDLWINELAGIWKSLIDRPLLESIATTHRGIQWHGDQSEAARFSAQKGFKRGVHAANAVRAFSLSDTLFLDYRPERLRRAATLPWAETKLLANAARLSRGPWCFAAAVDNETLIASQQLFGIWPKPGIRIYALCALLNGPIANAYIASHSPADRIRVATVQALPIPVEIPRELDDLVKRYMRIAAHGTGLFSEKAMERADRLLDQIDALVLKAYDLPPRLERQLLEYFRGSARPTVHEWAHWFPIEFTPFIPLHEFLSEDYRRARKENLLNVFAALPNSEAVALREVLD